MSQSGYNINDLVREAQSRWLKPAEVLFILRNHESQMITHEPSQKPGSGSVFLFNKRVLRFFRKDGHSWRRKKDGRTVSEAHERLKVGNVEALNCYYAHGEQNPNFQRRSYWMLNPAYEHIVLVHYRDISESRNNAGMKSQSSPVSSSTFNQSPMSCNTKQQGSSACFGESYDQLHNLSTYGSVELSSDFVINSKVMNYSEDIERMENVKDPSGLKMSEALQRLEEQLSLNEDTVEGISKFYAKSDNSHDSENPFEGQAASVPAQGHNIEPDPQLLGHEDWKEMLDGCNSSEDGMPQMRCVDKFYGNGILLTERTKEPVAEQGGSYSWSDFGGMNTQNVPTSLPVGNESEDLTYPAYLPAINAFVTNSNEYTTLFDQSQVGFSLEEDLALTIAQKQKFTIREISPEWGYASETTKVFIIGSFLCDPSESSWICMFGDIEVPVQIMQEGVICCHAPSHAPGKVTICITSCNREACSEVRDFEYRVKPTVCHQCSQPEATRTREELVLLVRLVQLLLSNLSLHKDDTSESRINLLGKSKAGEGSWDQVIEVLLVGTSTSSITRDWLLEELLKDKLQNWLSSKVQEENILSSCHLSKKEQGLIHMIAGLGFEWALHPILKSGVNVNLRDINGWTALHWAARFGREKMVAALIASGASAEAVTDPNPQDPAGKTAAFVASNCGHKGLAAYLSEMALTSHVSSLTLEESELSKGCANVEAERTFNSISRVSPTTNEDELSLKVGLAAVRSAALAAARIQSAFRTYSFRKRQQREVATDASINGDEYGIHSNDIPGLSAASKMAFHNSREYNSAALSIQKKYRGYKGRKDFLALRHKVVKIQAHVRGYQVRKNYRVCWAVSILEKIILRWRRHGVGLRGFWLETHAIDESEDEDILRVFRKQNVDPAIDEAVSRVLSMVESPEARQQYRRILEKYRRAKADLAGAETETASTCNNVSNMENDEIYQFT